MSLALMLGFLITGTTHRQNNNRMQKSNLHLSLTAAQYEKLVEYIFVGQLSVDGDSMDRDVQLFGIELLNQVLEHAEKFGKEHLRFITPKIPNIYFISGEKEEELLEGFEFNK